MLLVLFCTAHEASAQKKPKLKGLAKQIMGRWVIDGMDMDLGAVKTDTAAMAKYEAIRPMMAKMSEQMKGKLVFDFKADGTFDSESMEKGEAEKGKGTWKLEGNKLTMDMPDKGSDPKAFDVNLAKNVLTLSMQPKPDEPVKMLLIFKR
jgi:hypothetical protein